MRSYEEILWSHTAIDDNGAGALHAAELRLQIHTHNV